MKQLIFILFLISITLTTQAQPDSTIIKQIQGLRAQVNYTEILTLLSQEKNNDEHDLWLNYQLACYQSLLKNEKEAFKNLYRSIKLGAKGEDILTDSDFENLHVLPEWQKINDTLDEIYLEKNPNISNTVLSVELWHMYIEDQRFRTLGKNYKKPMLKFGTQEYTAFNDEQNKLVEARKKRLKQIIKHYGWPGYSMVGKEAADAAFYTFQHSRRKYLKKYLPYMEKAAMMGEASKANYAKMYDRLLMYSGKKQSYGTQLVSSGSLDKAGNYVRGVWQFHPIADFETVNERRLKMELEPIEDYAKSKNIEYNPNANIKMEKF
ncbi:MAG: hypothetical protein JEZ09_14370 [Salinivirgaceae bacterium]|nr:hypothetical protein [Salinivirgaceae bacterium]